MFSRISILFILLTIPFVVNAQEEKPREPLKVIDYSDPSEYEIAGITISGVKYLDQNVLINLSGLTVGQKILLPGDEISRVIDKFWSQGLFSDVEIKSKIDGNLVYLEIHLLELPRLSKLSMVGIKKSETDDLMEKLNIRRGSQVTDEVLNNVRTIINKHFTDKGFFNTQINIRQLPDTTLENRVNVKVYIDKNEKVRIKDIVFTGNSDFTDKRLRRVMKNTKKRNLNIFKASKFVRPDFKEDKESLITFYNKNGYRDAQILGDSIEILSEDRINLYIDLYEGTPYYFRDIKWVGNTKYPSSMLDLNLGIEKGDIYDQELLEKRLFVDEDGISSLYLDNGYLFFSVDPVEVNITGDSIDLEMRIHEGRQATINKVLIKGNTKTNEHVVRREIRTLPGELFSKEKIIRTVRELAQLGHFDPEKIEPNPIPNPEEGTVNLEYNLVERANDQLEVSGGWGAGMFVGTVGVRFSNFSARRLFDPKAWRPIPTGDGQTLSLRAQTNGKYYQSYNVTFVEPWLGGKKPNSFSVSGFHSIFRDFNWYTRESNDTSFMTITGGSVGFGKRLTWPDDFFTVYNEIGYQRYNVNNYFRGYYSNLQNGVSNNISFTTVFGRNSIDNPIYPRRGSNFSLGLELTPPYSLFQPGKDYASLPYEDKFKWTEYHKWTIKTEWYTPIIENLVLMTRGHFGLKGYYNEDIGQSNFEGYYVGGDGMSGYNLTGRETIALRGYGNGGQNRGSLTPPEGANLYNKYTVELRYPFSLNPQATIFALTFLEGGNAWYDFNDFNPFRIRRAAGVGLRAFLPMFGLLGVDWGYGFDEIPWSPGEAGGQFHFSIGQQF